MRSEIKGFYCKRNVAKSTGRSIRRCLVKFLMEKCKMKKLIVMMLLGLAVSVANADTLVLWQFDDKLPGEAAVMGERLVDSSGNGRDAFVNASSVPEFWEGNSYYGSGSAIHSVRGTAKMIFEAGHDFGDGGAVAGTGIGDFGMYDDFTLEAVVRMPTSNSNKECTILSKIGSDGVGWSWNTETTGRLNVETKDTDGNTGTSRAQWNLTRVYDGQWHHIAVVRDTSAGVFRFYVDGDNMGGSWADHSYDMTNDGLFRIGNLRDTDNGDVIGSIDMIRISNVMLTPEQFLQPMAGSVLPADPDPSENAFDITESSVTLSWTTIAAQDPNVVVNSHDVTIATDMDMTNVVKVFNGVTGNSVVFNDMDFASTYYWCVNTQGTDSGTPFYRYGNVWSYSTEENPANDIAAWWKFDDVTPGTVMAEGDMILDSSGNNRHLYVAYEAADVDPPLYGNPNPAYGSGGSCEAFEDSQLQLWPGHDFGGGSVAGSPIYVNGSFTYETVVRFDADEDGVNAILSFLASADDQYWYGSTLPQYWFRVESTGIPQIYLRSDSSTANGTGSTAPVASVYDGQWHHIAAVRDVSLAKLRLYVDRTLAVEIDDTTATSIAPSGAVVALGFLGNDSRNLEGSVDFIKVTRNVLSSAEFEQGVAVPTSPSPVDGATGVPLSITLSWSPIAGATITTQTVVLADDPYMQSVVGSYAATGNSVDLDSLAIETDYYWRVDTVGSDGSGSFTRQGPVWHFRTPVCAIDMSEGDLNGDCVVDVIDFAIVSANWLRSEYE